MDGVILAVLGAGAHAQDVAAIARAEDRRRFVKFYDDNLDDHPNCSQATRLRYTVGVNDPATKQRLARWGDLPQTVVHPTATIDPTAEITPGCVIGAGTHIGPGTRLGEHVHIGAGCTITRTVVGDFTTIAPGVDIAGDVTIGTLCLIGVGATIRNLTAVGDRVTVGAGAVVVRDIASDMTVAGVPARPLPQRPEAT